MLTRLGMNRRHTTLGCLAVGVDHMRAVLKMRRDVATIFKVVDPWVYEYSCLFEPLRRPLKLVWDLKNAPAGVDLLKLRDKVAEVGSNWSLNSRKVLWDWIPPYALLSQRASYSSWLGR